jgi:hypothetical protein
VLELVVDGPVVVCELAGVVVVEVAEMLDELRVLVFDVGLIVVVGNVVDDTTMVELELLLSVTDVELDVLVELVETTVDDVLTRAQSVETQYP